MTKESVEKKIAELFGKDLTYNLENIKCFAGDGDLYQYDKDAEAFKKVGTHGHGGQGSILEKEYFVYALEKDDTLSIQVKILYGGTCGDVCRAPENYYANVAMTESIFNVEGSENADFDDVYPQVQDKLPVTTFIYKKQSDGNFGLTEVKVE